MKSRSDLINKKEVSDAVGSLGSAASAVTAAAKDLSRAADKVARERDAFRQASTQYKSSYDSSSPTYSSPSTYGNGAGALERKLAAAEDQENNAAEAHQRAMGQLDAARQGAQSLLSRVQEGRNTCETNLAALKAAERQTQGPVLVTLRNQRSVEERNLREMIDFEKRLQAALSQAQSAGQGARRSQGGSSLEGRVGGTSGGFSRSSASIYSNPADVYSSLKRYPVETQMAADPYRMSGITPAYGSKYQQALRSLDRYF